MIARLFKFYSIPTNLVILNGILISILIGLNIFFQAFCIPTTWAIIILSICFLNTILYPFLERTIFLPMTSFINGVTCFVFIYCILFFEHMNGYGIVFAILGIGLVIYIPHFFAIQLLMRNLIRPNFVSSRKYFIIALFICIIAIFYIGYAYKKAIVSIEKFEAHYSVCTAF